MAKVAKQYMDRHRAKLAQRRERRKRRAITATPDDHKAVRTDAEERIAERDRLAALDNRSPAQVWLNDPPPWRSALGQRGTQ